MRGILSKYFKDRYLFLYIPHLNILRLGLVRVDAVKISRLSLLLFQKKKGELIDVAELSQGTAGFNQGEAACG